MTSISNREGTDSAPVAQIEISVLGGFEVVADGVPIEFPATASRLIAYLALHTRRVSRATLGGVLWPDSAQARAQANVRTTLWRIRSVHHGIIRAGNECLVLARDVAVDTETLAEAALDIGMDVGSRAANRVPISWFSCELLPEWYDDWIVPEREHYRMTALHILEGRAARYVNTGRYANAAECALAAINLAPLRESAHRALMQAYIADGNITEAIAQYRRYRDVLLNDLHIEPSGQMQALLKGVNLAAITNVA